MRIAYLTGVAAMLVTLVLDAAALAAAGGGSSGFGGGGGGGFSGGGSGGASGEGGSGPVVVLAVIVVLVLIVAQWRKRRAHQRRAARVSDVERAAAVAADDDEAFAADAVRAEATNLYAQVQEAWTARDLDRLSTLAGPDLLVEWERRLADFEAKGWWNRVQVMSPPSVEYVGLVNRTGEADDRVVVRIECELRDYVATDSGERILRDGAKTDRVTCREFWTLHRRDGAWRLESIEQEGEGDHHLERPIVATPWADAQGLRDEAVAERAAADAAPPSFAPAELADLEFEGTARAAALDLALADGRFDPDLIEASVRQAVEAWARAVDGDDSALAASARPTVLHELLHSGDETRRTRMVVRGPRIESVRIADLDAGAEPATVAVELDVAGRRYVEDRDTAAVLSGSRTREDAWTEHWTLALDGDGQWPWRIAGTRVAAH